MFSTEIRNVNLNFLGDIIRVVNLVKKLASSRIVMVTFTYLLEGKVKSHLIRLCNNLHVIVVMKPAAFYPLCVDWKT